MRSSSEVEVAGDHAITPTFAASPVKIGSPDGERPLQSATGHTPGRVTAAAVAAAGGAPRPVKEHGRFKVYEDGEQPPPFASPSDANGAVFLEEHAKSRGATPSAGTSEDAEADKAKRKGRFRYVEDDFGADGKGRISKATSSATLSDQRTLSQPGITSPANAPPVTVILPHLKEVLESITLQQETMREMVAAVADADRGKQAALNAFLQQRQNLRPSREEMDKLRTEVNELREENAKLRAMLREQSIIVE